MKVLLLIFAALVSLTAFAQDEAPVSYKGKGKVYIFGVSQELTDSVVYITTINEVDSVDIEKKTKFLPNRASFSYQLENYVESKLGRPNQTACVFFSAKKQKMSKKLYKIKKHYLDNPDKKIIIIDENKFRFNHPLDIE